LLRSDAMPVMPLAAWRSTSERKVPRLTNAISEAGSFDMLMAEIDRRRELAENSARRAVATRLGISTKC
jgi:hypothetical protein